jgi:hypothetical protein
MATNTQDSFLRDVVDNTVDDAPPNEIQLSNRRRDAHEFDSFRTTKWVKKLFRIAIKR